MRQLHAHIRVYLPQPEIPDSIMSEFEDTARPDGVILICPKCLTQYGDGHSVCEHDNTPLKQLIMDQVDALTGTTLDDRWLIQDKLGAGGMGVVYVAQQLNIERRVAIKTMNRGTESGQEFLERFLREANVASQVNHPHLVSIYDFGQTPEGVLYIVMEYLDGETLAERVRLERLTISQVLKIGIQLCAALSAAHEAGIVHRDLKPDNIFMVYMPGDDVFIKLLDFGIAKHMNSQAMTQTGQVFGTPEYMSPEQCKGKSNIDHRSDLYALGCILYELISGHTPFRADSMLQVLFRHVSDPVPELVPIIKDDSLQRLEGLVYRLLSKSRKKRHATALDVKDELEQILASLDDPTILQPSWRPKDLDDLSRVETARLGAETQDDLEMMYQELLLDDSEAEIVQIPPVEECIPTVEQLPIVEADTIAVEDAMAMEDTIAVEDALAVEDVVESEEPPTQKSPPVALIVAVLAVIAVGIAMVVVKEPAPKPSTSNEDAQAQEKARLLAAKKAQQEAQEREEQLKALQEENDRKQKQALVASALESAHLVLYSIAMPRAQEALEEAQEQKQKASQSRSTSRSNATKEDSSRALLGVRTPSSMRLRINKASKKAEACFSRRLGEAGEKYAALVGEEIVIRVFMDIAASGDVQAVSTSQVSGKRVNDGELFSCIKAPYEKIKFSPRQAIDGVERQGAELRFKLKRE
mgnify:CR=1 FL=1